MTDNLSRRPIVQHSTRLLVILTCLTIGGSAFGQLPHARLDSVFPPGGKIGARIDVKLLGSDLDNVDRLFFSHSGLSAAPKMESISELISESRPVPGAFTVSVAGDVPAGLYEVRAVGQFGISNPRWFHVDAHENVVETNDNTSAEKALPISVGSTVSGRADADRIDHFRFAAKAGQQVAIDCLAQRIDSRLDAVLALYDSSGREIGRRRSRPGQDALLAFTAPADGDYTLAIYDFLYRGGNDFFYRLSLSAAPRVTHMFPPCVLPETSAQVTLYGHNLPGGKPAEQTGAGGTPLEQQAVDLKLPQHDELLGDNRPGVWLHPCCGMLDGWLYQLDAPVGPSNTVFIGAAQAPVVVEREPNDAPQQATTVSVPCEFVGQFATRGDRDWAVFDAQTGQVLWIEVISHRLGAACDPVLHIEKFTVNAQGQEQVSRVTSLDDTDPAASNNPADLLRARSGDPVYRLAVDQDATYRIQVRDLYDSPLAGSNVIYRLVIRETQPDFRLVAFPLPADRRDRNKVFTSSPVLRRGGTTAFEVRCFRRHGFDGDVELSVEGLPAGVSCGGATMGGATTKAVIVLVAEENAPPWAGSVRIVGRATIGDREVEHPARSAAVVVRSENLRDSTWVTRLTQQLGLSVMDSETAPALLTAGDGNLLEVTIGDKLEVPLKVARRGEFAQAGNPVVDGLPAQIQVKAAPINNDGGKVELNVTNAQIPPGTYTFCVRAPVKQKRLRNAAAIASAEADAKRFEQLVKEKTEVLGQVTEAEKPQAEQLLKEAQRLKADADKQLNDTRNANKERDYTFELISTPVRLRIHPKK